MQPPALAALALLAALLLREVRGQGGAGPQGLSPARRAQRPRPGRPLPAGSRPPGPQEKRRASPARRGQRVPAAGSPRSCGTACCPGWSLAPHTQKCTKASCTPKCRNGGLCQEPQVCTCPPGFAGHRCEQVLPPDTPRFRSSSHLARATVPRPIPSTSRKAAFVRWRPLTPAEVQAVLRRRVSARDKLASALVKHLEAQDSKMAPPTAPPCTRHPHPPQTLLPGSWPGTRCGAGVERHCSCAAAARGAGMAGALARLLLPLAAAALLLALAAAQAPSRLRVLFTPTVCRLHCSGHRCTHRCERGNATVLDSGDHAGPATRATGFRVFLCPLLCQNGGVCIKKDQCLCPPGFTGKFCQIPAPPAQRPAPGQETGSPGGPQPLTQSVYTLPLANHQQERDGALSMVNVHVQHPPEAPVTIHQVERVNEASAPGELPANALPPARPALVSALAQSSPRASAYDESAGFGYCFQQLHAGECRAPLPGLRTQDVCCRGAGVAWGVRECLPCTAQPGSAPALGQQEAPCPTGFRRLNGSCHDVDECQEGEFCQNGLCSNAPGSFACLCHTGYLLDSSRSTCISHRVISEAKGPCYRVLQDGACALPTLRNITNQICCCSRVGKAWGWGCQRCPPVGSNSFKESCPAGPGYHYSAADLRYNTRFLGHDLPRVPISRQQGGHLATTSAPASTPRWTARPTATGGQRPTEPPPTLTPAPRVASVPSSVCERNPEICGPGRCVPRQGGYTCLCHPGFWLSTQGTHCIDVDECRQSPRPCSHGRCENSVGSYRCVCAPGYRASPAGTECRDIDECAQSPRPCAQGRCENTPGSYRCICPAGYRPSPSGPGCTDIDECAQSPPPCAQGLCENTAGSYRCTCPRGFRASPLGTECLDVDECQQSPPPCSPGRCENVAGGYRCLCPSGFRTSSLGTECVDVDECRQTPQPCSSGRCENSPGSYRCVCPTGFRLGPQRQCQDIDECENQMACPGQECVNLPGSFQCLPCREGYQPLHGRCSDIDECEAGEPCGPHGRCSNTNGSFRCQCTQGYRAAAAGGPCTDVNECLEGEFCFPHGECLNTDGSYTCLCAQGFATAPAGTSCLDIDECQRGGVCQGGRCTNTDGSFDCYCPVGFRATPEKRSCQDVDECQEYGRALCGAQRCENQPGSYRCLPACRPGYQATASGCKDVDECANRTLCGEHAVCHNLPGSFQCLCDQGYESTRDGRHCQDVNECETLQGVCGAELCENVEGSFLCLCSSSAQEFDPMTGRCSYPPSPPQPLPPGPLPTLQPEPRAPVGDTSRQQCYYETCNKVLAINVTHQECCCSLGQAWGSACPARPCPHPSTGEYLALCPGGNGYTATGPFAALTDVDECALFGSQLCRGGLCVNKAPGYSCYCSNGYYFERHHLECVDNDECRDEEAEPCVGGDCVNTIGSFYCVCAPPLVLDGSQRRCVANDSLALEESQAVCWQEVGLDLVCSRPRLDRQVTYTECCCLYGEAWGMDCALCPARDSDDFEALCNVLRPPSYGPARPGLGLPYEYSPEFVPGLGLPYGPELFVGSAAQGPPPGLRPDYDPYALGGPAGRRDSFYSSAHYEAGDFEDLTYVGVRAEELPAPYQPPQPPRSYRPRSPPEAEAEPGPGPGWHLPAHPANQQGQASQTPTGRLEGLPAEECGVLHGCANGRCVRVPQGFTCHCDPGFRLDTAHLTCLDIDECAEAEGSPSLCLPGRCLNVAGTYRCLCPRGFILSRPPHSCVPAQPRA
ncbi:latent-transforming growth factor beta-binding protein 4 isoform X2 [Carettochelys insculpta]|uniref:latent-transforming growth factor beta-binding protein 4 isoform X2 n=1 Tax=Carettochelys insculpta TaxID=44489 RepID=UPI003EBC4F4D